METTAKNATGTGNPPMSTLTSAGRVRISAITADRITPYTGTLLLFSRDQYFAPGTAPSRLNANSIRVVLVIQATVQKNCPAVEMIMMIPPTLLVSAWWKMFCTDPPTPPLSWTAKRKDSSKIQPPMAEYRIERQIPFAAESAALCVSSDRWAEAS